MVRCDNPRKYRGVDLLGKLEKKGCLVSTILSRGRWTETHPAENSSRFSGTGRHEREERESDANANGDPGKTPAVDGGADPGSVAVDRKTVESAGRSVLRESKAVSGIPRHRT